MSNGISYSEMVKELDNYEHGKTSQSFSIVYDKADTTRGKAGERVFVERAQKCGLPFSCKDNEMRGIVDVSTGKKTGVHLRLIFQFNGQTVYW